MLTFYGAAQEIAVQAAIKEAKAARKERLMAHIVNLESRRKEKQENAGTGKWHGAEARTRTRRRAKGTVSGEV